MHEEKEHLRSSLDGQSEAPDTLEGAWATGVQVEMLVKNREMQSGAQRETWAGCRVHIYRWKLKP